MQLTSMVHSLLGGFAAGAVVFTSTAARAHPPVIVKRIEIATTLSNAAPATVVGYFYAAENPNHKTLQVLLHGGTYNHTYWDAPTVNGLDYSYARYMAERGYDVLAVDMLGTGESSKPDGDMLTVEEYALNVSQILRGLRSHQNDLRHRFDRIALIGHSLGARIGVFTMGTYTDAADAFISLGWGHVPRPFPASDPNDPQPDLSQPYVAYPDVVRTKLYYYAPSADPAMIALDNASLADVFARGTLGSFFQIFSAFQAGDTALIAQITRVDRVAVPVLVQLGENDVSALAADVAMGEASFYASSPSVTVQTLSSIGHVFNLHQNHETGWEKIDQWLKATLGQ